MTFFNETTTTLIEENPKYCLQGAGHFIWVWTPCHRKGSRVMLGRYENLTCVIFTRPFYKHGLILLPVWIINQLPVKCWMKLLSIPKIKWSNCWSLIKDNLFPIGCNHLSKVSLTHPTLARQKWPPFSRRYVQIHFVEWKILYVD